MNWREINIIQYFYLNYMSKKIVRHGNGKIIPYKNAKIDLNNDSIINIWDGNISIGVNKLRGSKTETYIRLRSGSEWNAKERCEISYGSTIEILQNAKFDSQYFTMNSFSTIVAAKNIRLGNDVMIARNVTIYDSDFHEITYQGEKRDKTKEVVIGNHVWIGSNVMILKGVEIGDGSVISANALVTRSVMNKILVANETTLNILQHDVEWIR